MYSCCLHAWVGVSESRYCICEIPVMTNICHCDTVISLGEISLWCFALYQSFTLISTFTSFHITKVHHLGPSHHFCLIYIYSFLYLTRVSSFTLALSPLGFHRLLHCLHQDLSLTGYGYRLEASWTRSQGTRRPTTSGKHLKLTTQPFLTCRRRFTLPDDVFDSSLSDWNIWILLKNLSGIESRIIFWGGVFIKLHPLEFLVWSSRASI